MESFYKFQKCLSENSNKKVFKVEDACKNLIIKKFIINNTGLLRETILELKTIKKLQKLKVDWIVNLLDIKIEKSFINLIYEEISFSLDQLVKSKYKFDNFMLKSIAAQILTSISYMHGCNLIHKNLKTSNIFIDKFGKIKIGGFGLSEENSMKTKQIGKCTDYCAIELLLKNYNFSNKVDSWSIGCILIELATGNKFLKEKNEIDQIKEIFKYFGKPKLNNNEIDFYDNFYFMKIDDWEEHIKTIFKNQIDEELLALITELIIIEEDMRLSCKNACNLPIVKNNKNNFFEIL